LCPDHASLLVGQVVDDPDAEVDPDRVVLDADPLLAVVGDEDLLDRKNPGRHSGKPAITCKDAGT
jgi:hypothetical protein